ncbi:MAG TPA: ribosome recycling factor [Acidimicrobiales bacterium]|jgi:ribosome recycling factor|nr:ribosome recycling factor [Acidimicrobiales bacterium]
MTDLVLQDADEKMAKAVTHARHEFATVRTGRANPALVEKLAVDAYGVEMKLQELASFAIPEARQLVITPHDPQTLNAVEKSIRNADLGLAPSNDGRSIRLNFPPPTEQRRKELGKMVDGMAEEGKVAIRGCRRGARRDLDDLLKAGDVSEDEIARAEKELDKLTHQHEAEVEAARVKKVEELLEV